VKRGQQQISAIMRRVRSRDTAPEVLLRKALWAAGLRFRTCAEDLPGKPDIVNRSQRLAIFIDGDFWHGGQWRRRRLVSLDDQFRQTESREYWLRKIRRNMNRDCRATAALLDAGWRVVRFWESEVLADAGRCAGMILNSQPAGALSIAPRKTFAEFFAGIGLMRYALEKRGWTAAYANDIDPHKLDMYRAHFGGAFDLRDIHEIPSRDVPEVTLATASFPCNDLSLAGSRAGLAGKQSGAFWGLVRLLKGMGQQRPPLILLENVTGFLTSHGGRDFEQALLALNGLGYSVDAFILDAARFVPQSRQRLFVVGRRAGAGESGEARESDVRPQSLVDFIAAHPRIRWGIRELPAQPSSELRLKHVLENVPANDPAWWSPERAKYLLDQMSPRHRAAAEEMIAGSRWSYGTVFRRIRNSRSMAELRVDGIAGCLRTPRGGSGRQILLKAGKGRYFVRLLTPRECARLMGADDYRIAGSSNQALFGFGDAVCVPVIEWIAENYLNPVINELIHGSVLAATPAGRLSCEELSAADRRAQGVDPVFS
jgi:DNA (cytosine-5)-methyltransferase 1